MCHVIDLALGGRRRLHRIVDLTHRGAVSRAPSGLCVGPIGSYIGRRAPYVVSPAAVYAITDEPMALHLHAVFALSERQVDRIETLFSTLVYAFWSHVERHWQRICDEIESGNIIPGSFNRPRRRGGQGTCLPPPKKKWGKIFFGQLLCKIRPFFRAKIM